MHYGDDSEDWVKKNEPYNYINYCDSICWDYVGDSS